MFLFDILYFLVVVALLPLWAFYLFKKEYRMIVKHRFSPAVEPSREKRIWLHAVSLGEVKSLKNLIQQLGKTFDKRIVLSVTTPSGYKYAREDYPDIEVISAPFDFTFVIKKFIKKINPEILVLNELEIWPNWVRVTRKQGIPILLINGRISETAFKHYKRYLFFFKQFFRFIDFFLLQADIYKERFSRLGIPASRIQVCGNIKADEAHFAAAAVPPTREIVDFLKVNRLNGRIFTLASSHLADEQEIIPLMKKCKDDFSYIIVPRHLDRIQEIEEILKREGIKYSIWSRGGNIDLEKHVLVFDKIGYMMPVLKISAVVFMGGTFDKKTGGHNLYEPAALGKLIFGGPHYNNFPDIGRELVENGLYRVVYNRDELYRSLKNIGEIDFETVQGAAVRSVMRRRGSTECILREIQKRIKS